MLHHRISRKELVLAQAALLVAIALQLAARNISGDLLPDSHYIIIVIEAALAVLIGLTALVHSDHTKRLHHASAVILLALISFANISALVIVLQALVTGDAAVAGQELLAAAVAIFLTNIIVFGLWYWEVDSPGLTRTKWSKADKDFQFTQQDLKNEFPSWQPEFGDYLFLSITNAVNFAPADTRPLSRKAKLLMAAQALVSVFTLALVVARSVSILGQG